MRAGFNERRRLALTAVHRRISFHLDRPSLWSTDWPMSSVHSTTNCLHIRRSVHTHTHTHTHNYCAPTNDAAISIYCEDRHSPAPNRPRWTLNFTSDIPLHCLARVRGKDCTRGNCSIQTAAATATNRSICYCNACIQLQMRLMTAASLSAVILYKIPPQQFLAFASCK